MTDWLAESRAIHSWVVEHRRAIHRQPELAFQEWKTGARVCATLQELGVPYREGVGRTGVVADLRVRDGAPTIALRADMDALPVQEETDVPFRSEVPNVAHLCGHDGHVAMLLGAARLMAQNRKSLPVNVRFLFQPSEEKPPGGAPEMIRDGALEGVSEVFGLHVAPEIPVGHVSSRAGPILAQSDRFDIVVTGQGGHGSRPQGAIDPIPAAAELVGALQTIVSRRVTPGEPCVVSVCVLRAGDTFNVIPPRAELAGTARTLVPETSEAMPKWIEEIASHVASAHGCRAEVRYERGYPPLVNHAASVERVRAAVESVLGAGRFLEHPVTMYGEDFSHYVRLRPGAFAFIGAGHPDRGPVECCHSSRFLLDEEALAYGPAVLCRLVETYK